MWRKSPLGLGSSKIWRKWVLPVLKSVLKWLGGPSSRSQWVRPKWPSHSRSNGRVRVEQNPFPQSPTKRPSRSRRVTPTRLRVRDLCFAFAYKEFSFRLTYPSRSRESLREREEQNTSTLETANLQFFLSVKTSHSLSKTQASPRSSKPNMHTNSKTSYGLIRAIKSSNLTPLTTNLVSKSKKNLKNSLVPILTTEGPIHIISSSFLT